MSDRVDVYLDDGVLTVFEGQYVSAPQLAKYLGYANNTTTILQYSKVHKKNYPNCRAENFITLKGVEKFLVNHKNWTEAKAKDLYNQLAGKTKLNFVLKKSVDKSIPQKKRKEVISISSSSSSPEKEVEVISKKSLQPHLPPPGWWNDFVQELYRLSSPSVIFDLMKTNEFQEIYKREMEREVNRAIAQMDFTNSLDQINLIDRELENNQSIKDQVKEAVDKERHRLMIKPFSFAEKGI